MAISSRNVASTKRVNGREGTTWEILLFGFLGGLLPTVANQATKLLTRDLATIYSPSLLVACFIFGVIGLVMVWASGERQLFKALALAASAPGLLISMGAGVAKGETMRDLGVTLTLPYNDRIPTVTPNITASINARFIHGNVISQQARSSPTGSIVTLSRGDADHAQVEVALSNLKSSITTFDLFVCASAVFVYEASWITAFGVSRPPVARRLLLSDAHSSNDCRYATLIMVLAGSFSADERQAAEKVVAELASRHDQQAVNALLEQWTHFLIIRNFLGFDQDGQYSLLALLANFGQVGIPDDLLSSLRGQLRAMLLAQPEVHLESRTAGALMAAIKKFS